MAGPAATASRVPWFMIMGRSLTAQGGCDLPMIMSATQAPGPTRPAGPRGRGYRPLGQVMDSGAISGVLTSSWICACAASGMSRGLPRYTLPL
jgi:hypothetical protein